MSHAVHCRDDSLENDSFTVSLAGCTAVVTGGTKGLGFSIASALASKGMHVGAVGHDLAIAKEVWAERGLNTIEPIQANPEKPIEVGEAILQWLSTKRAKLRLLVNDAASYDLAHRLILGTSLAEWDAAFAVNVRAVFVLCKMLIPFLGQNGNGLIVNISSKATKLSAKGRVCYQASQAALETLTLGLAQELDDSTIAVVGLRLDDPLLKAGNENKRLTGFDYCGFLNCNALVDSMLLLAAGNAKSCSGEILSVGQFQTLWRN